MGANYVLDPFTAYKYDQKADKVDFPIFDKNKKFDPKNYFNVLKMAKLELLNHFGCR